MYVTNKKTDTSSWAVHATTPSGREPFILHNRRRWYILIIGSITYMCMHSYPYAIAVTVAFDTLVNMANVFFAGAAVSSTIEAVIADIFMRVATIVMGITINAFAAYVYDLSFFFGMQYFLMGLFMLIYIYIRMIDWTMPSPIFVDYFFVLGSLALLTFFMNFVIYGEPYTYLAEAVFIISVFFLVLISDLRHMQWWAFFIFVIFWVIGLVVGWAVNKFQMHHQYRYTLMHYFK